jgi:pyruvate/2-oxoglutarate dehydrogenase complex dihydrolipoamide dehydrogenase (E3) component
MLNRCRISGGNRKNPRGAILGVGGDEAVNQLTDAMYAGVSYKIVQRAVHIHPTVSELISTVLGQLEPLE